MHDRRTPTSNNYCHAQTSRTSVTFSLHATELEQNYNIVGLLAFNGVPTPRLMTIQYRAGDVHSDKLETILPQWSSAYKHIITIPYQ